MSLAPSLPSSLQLASGEVHSWCARLDVPPETFARHHATLTPDERTRSARFQFERDEKRVIVSDVVLLYPWGSDLRAYTRWVMFVYKPLGEQYVILDFSDRCMMVNAIL